ncbi:MAG: hypothetical protein KGL91_02370 [Xanthomonadaceae bacterium]|nr:hypothetical protein [Xanthomonadaceae bacterium]
MSARHPVFALLLLPLFALAQQQPGISPQALNTQAMAAYGSKDFATCARLLGQLVDDPALKPGASLVYNAACCQSLAGNPAAALALLDRASTLDTIAVANIEADADLAAARALPEWPTLRSTLIQREDARLAGLDRELRKELLARQVLDQDIRKRASAAGNPPPKALMDEWGRIDHGNTEWMKTVLARHGWPGKSLVGKDGASAAWLFVQHADMDKPFQKQAIALLEAAVAKGEAEGKDLAYLTDRILVGEDKPQRYGTQYHEVDGKLVPQPIEDREHVDARRAAVGLSTLAEYDRVMQANYRPPPGSVGTAAPGKPD